MLMGRAGFLRRDQKRRSNGGQSGFQFLDAAQDRIVRLKDQTLAVGRGLQRVDHPRIDHKDVPFPQMVGHVAADGMIGIYGGHDDL